MNLLLDTNALILFFEGSSNLSNNAKAAIESSNKIIFVSVISFWEIALKTSISKLEMNLSMEELEKMVWENGFEILPIGIIHTLGLRTLNYYHKDPFDRMIIQQALVENLNIVSSDSVFDQYFINTPIKRIW